VLQALKNKHMIVAMLVAPLLAVGSYYSVGYLFGEKPQPAQPGASYPLAEKPNCRYASGQCGLRNGDFEVVMTLSTVAPGRSELRLESEFDLQGVMVAAATGESADAPAAMEADGPDGRAWVLEVATPDPSQDRLRLVVSAQGVTYWGEVATAFSGQ